MCGTKCLAKKKTKSVGRTTDPVFNQILTFDSKHSASNLQVKKKDLNSKIDVFKISDYCMGRLWPFRS